MRQPSPKHWSPRQHKQAVRRYVQRAVVYLSADEHGWVQCVTCGARKQYRDKGIQGGHWLSVGGHPSVQFCRTNIHPQCSQCNLYHSGRPAKMERYIREHVGAYMPDLLKLLASQSRTWTREQLDLIKWRAMDDVDEAIARITG